MIIRSILTTQARRAVGRQSFRLPSRALRTTRRYSTSNASVPSTPQSQASMLATLTTDLDKIAPRFEIEPEQIHIIKTPAEFYAILKVGLFPSFHSCYTVFLLINHYSSFSKACLSSPLSNPCPCSYFPGSIHDSCLSVDLPIMPSAFHSSLSLSRSLKISSN